MGKWGENLYHIHFLETAACVNLCESLSKVNMVTMLDVGSSVIKLKWKSKQLHNMNRAF